MKYGRYEVVSEIGRGSMGMVYKAHDPTIDRLVALKVLRQDRVSSEDYVKRFLKEATAVGRLSHRGIVTVFDIGQDHGTIYIAMELLEGNPLDELIKKQQISFNLVVSVAREVAEALHYAHQKGIVHRDIKPANIICSENGEIKVTDFGIAHIEDPDGQQMTQAGEILGTPVYMSPEQVLGQPVDGRSDIYSLGVILYELTTGKRPFKAGNLAALFRAITTDPVEQPISVNPETPQKFSSLIMKAMARDPANRFPSGERLSEEITLALHGPETNPPLPAGSSSKAWLTAILALCICSGIGVLYYLNYLPVITGSKDIQAEKIEQHKKKKEKEEQPQESIPIQAETIEYISQTREKKTILDPAESDAQSDSPFHTIAKDSLEISTNPGVPPKKPPKPLDSLNSKPYVQDLEKSKIIISNSPQKNKPRDQDTTTHTGDAPSNINMLDKPAKLKQFPESWTSEDEKDVSKQGAEESINLSIGQEKKTSPLHTQPGAGQEMEGKTKDLIEKQVVIASLPQIKEQIEEITLLKLKSRPLGASIYIDGDFVGKTPFDIKLSAMKHEVKLQLQGHGDWKAQLDLSKGGEMPLSIRLLPQ